jgi:hypothetical protein
VITNALAGTIVADRAAKQLAPLLVVTLHSSSQLLLGVGVGSMRNTLIRLKDGALTFPDAVIAPKLPRTIVPPATLMVKGARSVVATSVRA